MVFSSLFFLFVFLPVTILLYYIVHFLKINSKLKTKIKNAILLVVSLIFYAWGGILYIFLMLASIVANYLFGYFIDKEKDKKKLRKALFIISIVANIGTLFVFKYLNFFVATIESFMHLNEGFSKFIELFLLGNGTGELGWKNIALPIGISFFTFQAMSYVIDVYQEKTAVQKNVFYLALYISFFPQLIAGPIVKYSDIEAQLLNRKEGFDQFADGVKRFCYGLGKKVLLSNTLAVASDSIWALTSTSLSTSASWLGLLCYTLQIYFDFSGYSDMAIGLGKMFGFRFNENFNYPYLSLSIKDFWRRWHISLSSWFKEYLYIPLGGNRKGKGRTCLNVFIVFLITGIWHGANLTFLLWGIYYGLFQIIEVLFLGKLLDKNKFKFINWIYAIFVVMIGWVFFRSDNVHDAFVYLGAMFSFKEYKECVITSYLSMKIIVALLFAIFLCGPIQKWLRPAYERFKDSMWFMIVDGLAQFAILIICVLYLSGGTYNPFIYFQF